MVRVVARSSTHGSSTVSRSSSVHSEYQPVDLHAVASQEELERGEQRVLQRENSDVSIALQEEAAGDATRLIPAAFSPEENQRPRQPQSQQQSSTSGDNDHPKPKHIQLAGSLLNHLTQSALYIKSSAKITQAVPVRVRAALHKAVTECKLGVCLPVFLLLSDGPLFLSLFLSLSFESSNHCCPHGPLHRANPTGQGAALWSQSGPWAHAQRHPRHFGQLLHPPCPDGRRCQACWWPCAHQGPDSWPQVFPLSFPHTRLPLFTYSFFLPPPPDQRSMRR